MTPEIFNRLLYQSEGDAIDFKVDQYPTLTQAKDEAKQEMLKDILAFANSWRASDGYIFRGVRDVQGGKAEVVGVERHFDDADLQEFVNKKTNERVEFGYEAFEYEGKQVGIFFFRAQKRPVYLRNDFGTLRRNTVYVRRGSSTFEASIEEATEMAAVAKPPMPVLEFGFYDQVKHSPAGDVITLRPINRDQIPEDELRRKRAPPHSLLGDLSRLDMRPVFPKPSKVERQLTIVLNSLLLSLKFCATNRSMVTANDVRFEARIPKDERLLVRDEKFYNQTDRIPSVAHLRSHPKDVEIVEANDVWILRGLIGKVQPGSTAQSNQFYLGTGHELEFDIDVQVFSDELSPIGVKLHVCVESQDGDPMTLAELQDDD